MTRNNFTLGPFEVVVPVAALRNPSRKSAGPRRTGSCLDRIETGAARD
jgi:hypothetical protein